MSPLRRSISATISCSMPYLRRAAVWTACSMASNTSSAEMPFSCATVSATRSNSARPRLELMSIVRRSLPSTSALIGGDAVQQCIGQRQLRLLHRCERDTDHATLLLDQHRVVLQATQDTTKAPLPLDQLLGFELGLEAGIADEVLGSCQ